MKKALFLLLLLVSISFLKAQPVDSIFDIRDDQIYRIVKIGQKWWMQENLYTGIQIDGTLASMENGVIEKYCYLNNESNCDIYGGLYRWYEAMDYNNSDIGNPGTTRGICPVGWHLPTDSEWIELTDSLGGESVAGGALKDTGTVYWTSPNTGANNSSGFTALPGGGYNVSFSNKGNTAYFWSASSYNTGNSWSRSLLYNTIVVSRAYAGKNNGFSVRCLRDPGPFGYLNFWYKDLTAVSVLDFTLDWDKDTIILINSSGGITIDVSSIHTSTSAFNMNSSSAVLSPGDSIYLIAGFNPPGIGHYTDSIYIESNDPFTPVLHLPLNGYSHEVDSITDYRDSQRYKVVKIDENWWMQENLNAGIRIDNNLNPSDNGMIEKYCYNNDTNNCRIYGGLYQWHEMMEYSLSDNGNPGKTRGICPVGWHLPTDSEWTALTDFLGGEDIAGGKLKDIRTVYWNDPNTGATNESGFTALPAGREESNYSGINNYAYFWSARQNNATTFWARSINYNDDQIDRSIHGTDANYSVRCLRNPGPYNYLNFWYKDMMAVSDLHFTPDWDKDTIILLNSSGSMTIDISSIHTSTPAFSMSRSSAVLSPGDSIHIIVSFNPPSVGYYTDSIYFESNDPFTPVIHLPLSGYKHEIESIIDYRDGQVYKVVKIDQQWWMKDNLNIGTRIDDNQDQADNGITEKYCYNNDTNNCMIYGGLYQWHEMLDYNPSDNGNPGTTRGICPVGWHLPTDSEWTELTDFLGGEGVAGGKLKDIRTVFWTSPNGQATNESGFTALPGGSEESIYYGLGSYANFWTSTKSSTSYAWPRKMNYNNGTVTRTNVPMTNALSVRCLRDPGPYTYLTVWDKELMAVSGLDFTLDWDKDTIILMNSNEGMTIDVSSIHTSTSAFIMNRSSAVLSPGDSIYLIASFNPPGIGHYTDSIYIESNDPITPVIHIPLSGYTHEIDSIKDFRDGKAYGVVKIGSQWWMQENLNTGTRIDDNQDPSDNGIIEKYCYNNDTNNCGRLGGLYKWDEMMDYHYTNFDRGICPAGWHLPKDSEWTELTEFLGGKDTAGGKLKDIRTYYWDNPNTNATNESGFSALPGGDFYVNYSGLGSSAFFWTSSKNDAVSAWRWSLHYSNGSILRYTISPVMGFSVRCVRDAEPFCYLSARDNEMKSISVLNFTPDWPEWRIILINTGAGKTIQVNTIHTSSLAFNTDRSAATMLPGDTIHMTVNFNPSQIGQYTDTIMIESDDPFIPVLHIPLSGYMQEIDSITDIRDGNIYKVVKIGQQWWLKENMNWGTMVDSMLVATDNGITEKYCYSNDTNHCRIFGGLYTWAEMMDYNESDNGLNPKRGICPFGWHLPNVNEWNALSDYWGGDFYAGGKLKTIGYNYWKKPNTGATNESGFSALPGGRNNYSFSLLGEDAYFWTSTQSNPSSAWIRYMNFSSQSVIPSNFTKTIGLSVRCLKDPVPMRHLTVWDTYFKDVSTMHFTEDNVLDTIIIYNSSGGNTLDITSIHTSTGSFDLSHTSAFLLPGDSIHLMIRFNPQKVEEFVDTIFLVSNDPYDTLVTIPLTSTLNLYATFTDIQNISCSGIIDGSATITPFMGTPPYTYKWNDPWNTTDSTVTGLRPNQYFHVTVTDSKGESVTDSIMLSEPEPLVVKAEYSEHICSGSNDGFIILSTEGGIPPYNYLWSSGQHEQEINNLAGGEYSVTVIDDNGCTKTGNFTIADAVPYPDQQICIVTIDINSGRNLVVWEKTPDKGIAYFNIYRENNLIGTLPFNELSIFIDSVADPATRPYLYQISIIDSCNHESGLSPYHKPLFLQYIGYDGGVQLDWDEYEIEGEVVDFEKYTIYRGSESTSSALNPIEDVPVVINKYTDKDPLALTSIFYYRIAGILNEPCYPTFSDGKKANPEPYNHSLSNVEDNRLPDTVTMIHVSRMESLIITPNPTSGSALVSFNNPDRFPYTLYITDLSGRVFMVERNITTSSYLLESRKFKEGIYFVELRGPRLYRGKLVIE